MGNTHTNSKNPSLASVDGAILVEAHGLIGEMLSDPSVPPNIVSGLRAVANLLAPPPTISPLPMRDKSNRISISLAVFNNSESDSEENPYLGERTSNMPKKGKRNLSQSVIRRMSTSTWTTTTTATGLPTLEPEPSKKRSTSFRNLHLTTVTNTSSSTNNAHSTSVTTAAAAVVSSLHNKSPSLMKYRSHSTTSLPIGILTKWQNTKTATLRLIRSGNNNNNNTRESPRRTRTEKTRAEENEDADTEDEPHGAPQRAGRRDNAAGHLGRNNARRMNLTSDYDSSGSELTIDESQLTSSSNSAAADFVQRILGTTNTEQQQARAVGDKSFYRKASTIDGSSASAIQCTLCGAVLNRPAVVGTGSLEQPATASDADLPNHLAEQQPGRRLHHLRWPFVDLPPPVTPRLNPRGHYIIENVCYDLEAILSDRLLRRLHEWDYPIFELSASMSETILSKMSYFIFSETGLLDVFRIPVPEFLYYFRALESGYHNKPYHNRIHAADVLQGVFYFTSQPIPGFTQIRLHSSDSPLHKLSRSSPCAPPPSLPGPSLQVHSVDPYGLMGGNCPSLELMALYTAAAMHDYDHPGRTNAFLVTTYAPQAILYNDRSVLENHHAAAAWSLFFSTPRYNWLRHLDRAEFKRFRYLVIEFILATDLKRHFEILAEFNAKVNEDDSVGVDWYSEGDRLLVLQMSIKLADINGPCKRRPLHLQWTQRIAEEFYEQGDEEARLGLVISPYMDRRCPQLARLQESFINHLVAPLCSAYGEAGLLPGRWCYEPTELDQHLDPKQQQEAAGSRKASATSASTFGSNKTLVGEQPESPFKKKAAAPKSERRVICVQTKNLQDNYEFWIEQLKQEKKDKEPTAPTNKAKASAIEPTGTTTLEGIAESDSESLK